MTPALWVGGFEEYLMYLAFVDPVFDEDSAPTHRPTLLLWWCGGCMMLEASSKLTCVIDPVAIYLCRRTSSFDRDQRRSLQCLFERSRHACKRIRHLCWVSACFGCPQFLHLQGKLDAKNFVDYCSYFHNGDGHASAQINKRWQVWGRSRVFTYLIMRNHANQMPNRNYAVFEFCCFLLFASSGSGGEVWWRWISAEFLRQCNQYSERRYVAGHNKPVQSIPLWNMWNG